VSSVILSRDGQNLYSLSENGVTRARYPNPVAVATLSLPGHGQALALHPEGEYLVAAFEGVLAFVHLKTLVVAKIIYLEAPVGLERDMMERFSPKAVESFLNPMDEVSPSDPLVQLRQRNARHGLPKQSVFSVQFSPNGSVLLCGTHAGLCLLKWDRLLTGPSKTGVTPDVFIEAEPSFLEDCASGQRLIYSMATDAQNRRVLFAGLEGKIRFVDLNNGCVGDLLVPPLPRPFSKFELTTDRTRLVGTMRHISLRKQEPPKFQIWSYPALCKAAGLDW
jgi:hypothetical protein